MAAQVQRDERLLDGPQGVEVVGLLGERGLLLEVVEARATTLVRLAGAGGVAGADACACLSGRDEQGPQAGRGGAEPHLARVPEQDLHVRDPPGRPGSAVRRAARRRRPWRGGPCPPRWCSLSPPRRP